MGYTLYTDTLSRLLPFWGQLDDAARRLVSASCREAEYSAGQMVFDGGSECLGLTIVLAGELRAFLLSDEGREITLYRMGKESVCLLTASCILSSPGLGTHVEARVATRLLVLPATVLASLTKDNIYVECCVYRLLSERFAQVMRSMERLLFTGVDRRLASFLLDELEGTGGNTVYMTHEQIAKCIGSAREVVSRTLGGFAENGTVELSRGGIKLLRRDALRRLAGNQTGGNK